LECKRFRKFLTMQYIARPKVGFLSAFYGAYDDVMGAGFRPLQTQAAAGNRTVLERHFDVTDFGVLSSLNEAEAAARKIASARIEALIYAPTMVAPPEWIEVALRQVACPIVVWSATRLQSVSSGLDHRAATVDTSLVGATMLANCFVRRGQRFAVVDAVPENPADEMRLTRTVNAAVAARRLNTAVALRVGAPIAGYRDVETTAEELNAVGIREIDVSVAQWERAFAAVSARDVEDELAALRARANWRVTSAATGEASARLALALRRLTQEHGATVGTVNCHSCWFRQHDQIGIVACLGVSLLLEAGISFSCTGDLPAALAGLLAKALSGSSLYCELYVREPDTDQFLVAAGGEGDPTWAQDGNVDVVANEYYPGRCGAGLGVRFALQRGPATVISMTPTMQGWRLIWAPGAIIDRTFPSLDGPNGMFRFATQPGQRAAEQWIGAGPTHHAALARGHLDLEMPLVATLANLTNIRV
jgi:L-arabinose isomerase